MGTRPGEVVGVIYGHVEATEFRFAMRGDAAVKRLDYISAEHPSGLALGQVVDVDRLSQLSFEEAVQMRQGQVSAAGDYISCKVKIVGYRDDRGLLQMPRSPFKAGTEVRRATANLIQRVLGLTSDPEKGAYLGFLKGTESPVVLDINSLVQKHVSVLAKTGAGKSYTVGVLIEELLKRRVPLVIIDAHGEYTTLSSPNIEPDEIDRLIKYNLKPKAFHGAIHEYALEKPSGGRKRLQLDGRGLEAREILDLLPEKPSPAAAGLLYQAINELKKIQPNYTLKQVIDEIGRNPSNAKWPVMGAIENLEATGLYSDNGTGSDELVVPGQCTIINFKGILPEVQQMGVARLATALFEARKKNKIPPFMFVVEECHNYCPQQGSAISGPVLRTIASEGRKFGMGLLVVSQRPAKVDKNVLSQCNTQIIMKVTNPNDLKAITASVEGLTTDTADEIQRLDIGVAMVASPGLAQPILVEVRTRQTRHGGRSVDVLQNEEPEEEAEPEPEVRTLPPPPVYVPPAATEVAPVTHHEVRPAHTVPVSEAERPLLEPKARPWSPRKEPQEPLPPLIDGEVDDTPEAPTAPSRPSPKAAPVAAPEMEFAEDDEEETRKLKPPPEPEDVALHRVVARVGYSTHSPREAMAKVRELSKNVPEMSPDDYVRAFARVARTYCYPSHPECGPCPILRTCRLGMERLGRGEVREGKWGQRAS
ncbi:MAG: DUF87 domain-containing protein [Euryarchaeota archaeon]|nr:DUF87 domain-containing protein [Euryarchaeota archaeon]